MKFKTQILLLFFLQFSLCDLTDEQTAYLSQVSCSLTKDEFFVNFVDQGNMILVETDSGYVYEYQQVLAIKHFILSPEEQSVFDRTLNELKNLEIFSSEIDIQSSLSNRCNYTYNESTNQLEIFVILPSISETLDSILDQNLSLEQKLVLSLKLIFTLQKLHKNGYLHGDIQPKSFYVLNKYSYVLGNLKYLRKQNTLEDYNKNSRYIEESLQDIDGYPQQQQQYDIKAEIFSLGEILSNLFLYKLDQKQITLEDTFDDQKQITLEDTFDDQEQTIIQDHIDSEDQIDEQDQTQQQRLYIMKDLTQKQQENFYDFVDSLLQLTQLDRSQRADSLDELIQQIVNLLQNYYKNMSNKMLLNRALNQEFAFLNSIQDKSLRFRLVAQYQQIKKFFNFAMLRQNTKQIVDQLTTLNVLTEEQLNQLKIKQTQRNFSTVQGDNKIDRYSQLQNRESYFANAYMASNIDAHTQQALYQQKELEKQLRHQEALKTTENQRGKGCCGFFFIQLI